MGNELRSIGHTVGETNLHLQFTPAYRCDIFREPLARELTIAYILQRAREMKIEIAAIECGPDHLHLFAKQWKNWKIPVLAGQLKTYSSRMMRKGHSALFSSKLWGKKFWSAGYFHIIKKERKCQSSRFLDIQGIFFSEETSNPALIML